MYWPMIFCQIPFVSNPDNCLQLSVDYSIRYWIIDWLPIIDFHRLVRPGCLRFPLSNSPTSVLTFRSCVCKRRSPCVNNDRKKLWRGIFSLLWQFSVCIEQKHTKNNDYKIAKHRHLPDRLPDPLSCVVPNPHATTFPEFSPSHWITRLLILPQD